MALAAVATEGRYWPINCTHNKHTENVGRDCTPRFLFVHLGCEILKENQTGTTTERLGQGERHSPGRAPGGGGEGRVPRRGRTGGVGPVGLDQGEATPGGTQGTGTGGASGSVPPSPERRVSKRSLALSRLSPLANRTCESLNAHCPSGWTVVELRCNS